MKITDFKIQFKDIDSALRAAKMFELRKQISISVMDGKFRESRKYQKELAQEAVNDFDTYSKLPLMRITKQGLPDSSFWKMAFNTLKCRFFSKFYKKTPEEKQLYKMSKEYFGRLTKEDIKNKTIDITIPSLF